MLTFIAQTTFSFKPKKYIRLLAMWEHFLTLMYNVRHYFYVELDNEKI